MSPKKRFIRITSELVLILETHRTVLEWMRLEGRKVELSSVTLTPRYSRQRGQPHDGRR